MRPMDVEAVRRTICQGRVEWRKHALQKLAERVLAQDSVLAVLLTGEKIRDYLEDRPFPSALFLGYVEARPVHVVAAWDEAEERVFIITAYEPSADVFGPDYRTKKKS